MDNAQIHYGGDLGDESLIQYSWKNYVIQVRMLFIRIHGAINVRTGHSRTRLERLQTFTAPT